MHASNHGTRWRLVNDRRAGRERTGSFRTAMDRRRFLSSGAVAGSALWLPWDVREADARAHRKAPLAREGTFASGVASGDPSPTAVTFWTRLDGQAQRQVRVKLVVATDPQFKHVVLRRRIP